MRVPVGPASGDPAWNTASAPGTWAADVTLTRRTVVRLIDSGTSGSEKKEGTVFAAIVAGAALSVAGSVVMWRCVWDFGHVGRGTPAPFAAPTRHVTVGFYRRVRNPMQMGLILSLFGLAAAYMAIWILGYALAVCVCMHLFVVLYEEPTLRRKFGESYRAYCASVPRWIPRVRRASAA